MIRRYKRVKRKSAHRELVEEADAWVKAIVLERQGPECLKCKKVKPLQGAHILGKGANPALRYDLENVIGLCVKCHLFWCHRDPIGFSEWVEEIFPGRLQRLREKSKYYCKIDLKELLCVLKDIHGKESTAHGHSFTQPIRDEENSVF